MLNKFMLKKFEPKMIKENEELHPMMVQVEKQKLLCENRSDEDEKETSELFSQTQKFLIQKQNILAYYVELIYEVKLALEFKERTKRQIELRDKCLKYRNYFLLLILFLLSLFLFAYYMQMAFFNL